MAVIMSTASLVKAQSETISTSYSKKPLVSIGANLGVPVTSGYKIAYGADLQIDIPFADKLFGTVSGGYENYSYKTVQVGTVTVPEGNTNFIPVLAGIKYFFSDKFYGHGEAGYTFSTTKNGGGSFTFAPSVGYYFCKNFDASVKYINIGQTNSSLAYGGKSIGSGQLRLAYTF